MPLAILPCPQKRHQNGVKSTFRILRGHGTRRLLVKTSYVRKIGDFVVPLEVLNQKCRIYVTKSGDFLWGRKEHKGWWLQVSFRVLSVSIADTTVIALEGRCHPPQLTLFRTLTSHPLDAWFCSHKLTKLLLSVWSHSEHRVIPNYRIWFSESCHEGTIHWIDTDLIVPVPLVHSPRNIEVCVPVLLTQQAEQSFASHRGTSMCPLAIVPHPCHQISVPSTGRILIGSPTQWYHL